MTQHAQDSDTARTRQAVIPVTPVVETLRHIPTQKNVLRSDYCLVQTPQCFDIQLLKAANKQPYSESFTDDASVVEAYGHEVTMVEGNRENSGYHVFAWGRSQPQEDAQQGVGHRDLWRPARVLSI